MRYGLLWCLAALVSGCAAAPPVAEVRLISKAFDDLNVASAPLFDDLATAERWQGRAAADARATSDTESPGHCSHVGRATGDGGVAVLNGFCVEDSPYYTELTDPPATAAFRRSLRAVGEYTRVLLVLAEGSNVEAAIAGIQTIASDLGGTFAVAGAAGLAPGLSALTAAFEPLLEVAARRSNARELARNVTQVSPLVIAVTGELRASTPVMFDTLVEPSLATLPTAGAEEAKAAADRVDAYRAAVSSYVVLLERYERLLRALAASYDDEGRPLTLAGLAEESAELSARADAWRRTFSALRLGLD